VRADDIGEDGCAREDDLQVLGADSLRAPLQAAASEWSEW
jgi:hypothetical protein